MIEAPADHGTSVLRTSKQIRVFISSTFRDMQRERELLVKQVFPELRRLCAQRSVTFTEVDLRWGITEEQAAEGEVLPICLEGIHLSRPYFIGLLGERYGWIPQSVPPSVIAKEPWLREHVTYRTSVTELEILHGVLNNTQMGGHARFYFRDLKYLETLPDAERLEMTERNVPEDVRAFGEAEATRRTEERKAKLAALKQRIRESGFPVFENYANPEALAAAVREDFLALIDRLYPESATIDALDQEALGHDIYAARKLSAYVPRPAHTVALDAFVSAESTGQGLVITGDSGGGKTTLLSNWVQQLKISHKHDFIFTHYFGSTPDSTSVPRFLRRLLAELKRAFTIPDDIPSEPDVFRLALARWLNKTNGKGRIVLVLDGLDQIEGGETDRWLVWLPRHFPPHVRVLASGLPGPALDALRDRGWGEHKLPPIDVAERRRMIDEFFLQYRKQLAEKLREQLAAAPSCSNPLFLRVILEELRQFGSFERLPAKVAEYLSSTTLGDLFRLVLRRWQQDFDANRNLVCRTLCLLWAARQGLTEVEWRDLLGTPDQPLLHQVWSPLFLAIEPHLVLRAGLHAFGHDFLRQAVGAEFLADRDAQKAAHLAIANYFAEKKDISPRKVAELFWQLRKAEAWGTLIEHLRHAQLVQEAWESNQFDVTSSWTELESAIPGSLPRAYDFILRSPDGYIWLAGKRSGVADYLLVLADTFWFCGYPQETFKLCDAVLKHFADVDVAILWRAARLQCKLFINRGSEGDLQAAWDLASEFRRIAGGSEDRRIQSAVMSMQETILLTCNQSDAALEIIREYKQLARAGEYRDELAVCLGNEAVALTQKGESAAALRIHHEEERLCREQGDLDGLQACLGNQANVLATQGLYEDALVLLTEQEQICSQIGKMASLANCYSNQAFAHAKRGRRNRARELLQQQETLARRMGSEIQLRIAIEAQKALDRM